MFNFSTFLDSHALFLWSLKHSFLGTDHHWVATELDCYQPCLVSIPEVHMTNVIVLDELILGQWVTAKLTFFSRFPFLNWITFMIIIIPFLNWINFIIIIIISFQDADHDGQVSRYCEFYIHMFVRNVVMCITYLGNLRETWMLQSVGNFTYMIFMFCGFNSDSITYFRFWFLHCWICNFFHSMMTQKLHCPFCISKKKITWTDIAFPMLSGNWNAKALIKMFQNCVIDTNCINIFLFFLRLQEKGSFLPFSQTPNGDGTIIQHTGGQWKAVMQTGLYFWMLIDRLYSVRAGSMDHRCSWEVISHSGVWETFCPFLKCKCSLLDSQGPATEPRPEPDESRLHSHAYFFKI
jgi:hypothetical protein